MKREPEPLEQIDYGESMYRARGNQVQKWDMRIQGGGIAIAISLLAFGGVLVACILLPQLQAARTEAEIAKATKSLAVTAQSAADRAWKSDQTATIASEQVKILEMKLAAKRLIDVQVDGH